MSCHTSAKELWVANVQMLRTTNMLIVAILPSNSYGCSNDNCTHDHRIDFLLSIKFQQFEWHIIVHIFQGMKHYKVVKRALQIRSMPWLCGVCEMIRIASKSYTTASIIYLWVGGCNRSRIHNATLNSSH